MDRQPVAEQSRLMDDDNDQNDNQIVTHVDGPPFPPLRRRMQLGDPGRNPTGKGGFQPGQSGYDNGKAISAGKRLSEELGKAILANDAAAIKENVDAIVTRFRRGEEWATQFVWNRTAGTVAQALEGKDGGPIVITLTREDADL